MTKNRLTINYQYYIPKDIIDEVESSIKENDLNFELITLQNEEETIYNFVDFDIPSISIYINKNLLELIIGGTIGGISGNLVYDFLKSTIKRLFRYLKQFKIKRITSQSKSEIEGSIAIEIQGKDHLTTFILKGDLNDDLINNSIEQAFKYQMGQEILNDLKNPDFYNGKISNQINLFYNSEKKLWIPYNYREFKVEIIRLKNKINNDTLD